MPVRVGLYLDDLQVASVWAADPNTANSWGVSRSFTIALPGVWHYCREDTRLSIRVDGEPLPIAGKGIYKKPSAVGDGDPAELARLLSNGHVFNRAGVLQLSKSLDLDWQARMMSLVGRISDAVREFNGHDCFAMYGTLLGQVREQGFIGHDNDVDIAYLSTQTDGRAAALDHKNLGLALIDGGFDVEVKATALHVREPGQPADRVDIFHLYFGEDGLLKLPFGNAGTTTISKDQWHGLTTGPIGEHEIAVPVDGEQWAEHLYGETWRTPVAGFAWALSRKAFDEVGRTTPAMREEGYWANFYARHGYSSPSTFFDFVNGRADVPNHVVDIGCGDGRDSFAFAKAGRDVVGVDRSTVGVRHASERAARSGMDATLRFRTVDVTDAKGLAALLVDARQRADGGALLLYLRFFLHSIPAPVQASMLRILSDASRPGDMLAAEFRTDGDEAASKVHEKHYRRFQNAKEFLASLETKYGFVVDYQHEGRGMSPYGKEDPVLCRVLARVPDRSGSGRRQMPAAVGRAVLPVQRNLGRVVRAAGRRLP